MPTTCADGGRNPAGAKTGAAVQTLTVRVGGNDYRLRALLDKRQYADVDGSAERAGISLASWPLFGMLWPAGIALAQASASLDIAGKRILEVGCGLALPSLVLKRRGADITASDYHPSAEEFLRFNAEANGLPPIAFRQAAWADADLGLFDLIIGADVLYERGQPEQLSAFISRHAALGADVVISDPGRRQIGKFRKLMADFTCSETHIPPKGRLLFFRQARGR